MSDTDLQQPDGGTDDNTSSQSTSPGGQSNDSDWEARFKGLQRKYNTLVEEKQSLEEKFAAKDNYAVEVVQELQDTKNKLALTQKQVEGQLTEKQAEIQRLTGQLEEKDSEITTFQQTLQQREEEASLRKELSKYPDVLPFFESGHLNLRDEEGKPLSGEALEERVTSFTQQLGQRYSQDFDKTMSGTVPTPSTPPSAPLKGADEEQLQEWLMNNADHDSYDAVSQQYEELVAKRMQGVDPWNMTKTL